ncbi:transposase [Methylomonas sp. SURF-2]|uniref:Transposase n=1 Tax=Methylomonas subterranea TaxID=2952225 RepID=A0ABT1TCA7_9GAMM|nr:transposase [Methylomonas sp. SURF-2]MCQ8102737.1 transposase [Methylomonas sp. SURF-2]
MLKDLEALAGALVVMDAGIATESNLIRLREHGYRYLVVIPSAWVSNRGFVKQSGTIGFFNSWGGISEYAQAVAG